MEDVSRMIFESSILGGAHYFKGDPYLNSKSCYFIFFTVCSCLVPEHGSMHTIDLTPTSNDTGDKKSNPQIETAFVSDAFGNAAFGVHV